MSLDKTCFECAYNCHLIRCPCCSKLVSRCKLLDKWNETMHHTCENWAADLNMVLDKIRELE